MACSICCSVGTALALLVGRLAIEYGIASGRASGWLRGDRVHLSDTIDKAAKRGRTRWSPNHPKGMITFLAPNDWDLWLRGAYVEVVALPRPYPAGHMTIQWPVFPT